MCIRDRPVVEFGGNVIADIVRMEIENDLLKSTRGSMVWRQALLTGSVNAQLGQVVLDVVPEGQGDQLLHRGKLTNNDGQIDINGDFQLGSGRELPGRCATKTQ